MFMSHLFSLIIAYRFLGLQKFESKCFISILNICVQKPCVIECDQIIWKKKTFLKYFKSKGMKTSLL